MRNWRVDRTMDVGNGTLLSSNVIASNPIRVFGRVFFFDDFRLLSRLPRSSSVSPRLLFWKLHLKLDESRDESDVRTMEVESQF